VARRLVEEEWGARLIRGWNDGWLELAGRVGEKIGRLLGAAPGQVTVADSTSVNLFKLATAALRSRPGPYRIVTDDLNFPSDLYVLRSALEAVGGGELEIVRSPDGITMPSELLEEAVRPGTTLVSLSHAAFKSAFVYDMAAVTELAHRVGALVLWDLSHSAGAVPVDLDGSGADLAVGCGYKYLNGGPGAPAFLYVRSALQRELRNPIAGWLGRDDPFGFALDYEPACGVRRFVSGTPPVLSLAMIEPGVDLLLEAGMERVREKSLAQTEYLVHLWEERLAPLGYRLASPREPARRGSHVSLAHPEGWRINRALIERLRVIPDFRAPDVIRLGVCPLYTTYRELYRAAEALRAALTDRLYEQFPPERSAVT
jgi:kynureninase